MENLHAAWHDLWALDQTPLSAETQLVVYGCLALSVTILLMLLWHARRIAGR